METYGTPPCSSEGPLLYDTNQIFYHNDQILYDNNHLNKIDPNQLAKTYRKDEAIVYLDKKIAPDIPMDEKINRIKETFCKKGIPIESITTRQCSNCGIDMPLFLIRGKGIDTVIVSEGVPGGSSPQPHTVGESYSLNFLNQIPHSGWRRSPNDKKTDVINGNQQQTVTIAVLDTGIDTCLIDPAYICDGFTPKKDLPCFIEVKKGGWNFLENNDNYFDDNNGKHGTLVSQFIINQFKHSPNKRVKIMPLKTHDENGGGDLFSIICAIHFAMAKGANIINASWGFYYYYDDKKFLDYFQNLIGNELRDAGILFVTASGNRIEEEDSLANDIYSSQNNRRLTDVELRDLGKHKFFPAHLSDTESNIVTVTTTNETGVSEHQNHSDVYVDLGVFTNEGPNDDPTFEVPFKLSSGTAPVAGSSFATAIATGVIGAKSDTELYEAGLKKGDFINTTGTGGLTALPGMPSISVRPSLRSLIRNGTYITDYIKA